MTKSTYLSIIIPSYNEETNIRLGALDQVARYLSTVPYTWEVLLVNDGSTDDTKKLLATFAKANPGFILLDNPHQGKAATVIAGMLAGKGDIVLFTDLDQATPIKELEKVLPWFAKGYDVVIGSRSVHRLGAPFLRRLMGRGFMTLRSLILGLPGISDTQCGFKAFRRAVVQDIFGKLKLYAHTKEIHGSMVTAGFDIEVLYLTKKNGYKIKEIPVEWHYVDTRRVSPLKDSWRGFTDLVQIRLNEWRGKYQ